MTKRMLIDASHAEETRVVVLDGNRLEDFDVETQSRRQLKGNIYLAKIVRVEPSLQAAFVEYGGNRHGFLAFGEIHPDYYQIPVADRQRLLLQMQEEEARAEQEAEDDQDAQVETPVPDEPGTPHQPDDAGDEPDAAQAYGSRPLLIAEDGIEGEIPATIVEAHGEPDIAMGTDMAPEAAEPAPEPPAGTLPELGETADLGAGTVSDSASPEAEPDIGNRVHMVRGEPSAPPETVGGDSEHGEEAREKRPPSRFMRSYKIQEVIRRRQILLIQVVKEERGTKGAALTTYISLAGRYCVLMPNSPRGGGISRKITSASDRKRLKEVTAELEIPRGMGLIVRTAGAMRPKAEIKRDGEYLLRLWDDIREQTMQSMAPSLIYEEATLIKRAIRDVYSRDVDELLIDGEDGWKAAREFMRMLMPAHVKKVQLWPQNGPPLFAHQQVESMLDSMLNPVVQLRSGGYLVINQTEALVAIDVNSGRSTRERGIEETALRTNLEAAEEAARQVRLRDLAGLIVIDFIDMESKKHNAMVERRMADALKSDRARIQVGHISHFGLLEMSRQRLRPSLAETSLNMCHQCGGTGHVRSTESAALHVLREIEEEGGRRRAAEILVYVAGVTALYILNYKRQRLTEIEQRYAMRVGFAADDSLLAAQTRIERLRAQLAQDFPPPVMPPAPMVIEDDDTAIETPDEEEIEQVSTRPRADAVAKPDDSADPDAVPGETAEEGERRRKRRRRRRRGSRREDGVAAEQAPPLPDGTEQPDILDLDAPMMDEDLAVHAPVVEHAATEPPSQPALPVPQSESVDAAEEDKAAKRGRRGGRRRRRPEDEAASKDAVTTLPDAAPAYAGPTPADPFAVGGMDIFEVLEQAEAHAEQVQMPPLAEPVREAEAAQPASGPVIMPVMVGNGEPAAQPKRGWWRR